MCQRVYNNLILKFNSSLSLTIGFLAFAGLARIFFCLMVLFLENEVIFLEFIFLQIRRVKLPFVLLLDKIRLLFGGSVLLIRLSVLRFRKRYIEIDKFFKGFHLILASFVVRILFLIFSPNLLRALIGWDGLGLRSYILVIYYKNSKAFNSGILTGLRNRIGDILILRRLGIICFRGRLNFCFYKDFRRRLAACIIIVAATTKRAQIPFSAWLPAAMAAPTPVSSLVHSSTLVTAGVYLLIRHERWLFEIGAAPYLLIIGRLTIALASLRALFEVDIKKIVALSTLRQLGVMIMALGINCSLLRFFHLLRHAFFKALLFISTGNLIHASLDYQDLRFIGSSFFSIPISLRFVLVARFRLCGLPFMSAFFSKEIVLERILYLNNSSYAYCLIMRGIFLTACYRFRFLRSVFLVRSKSERLTLKNDQDMACLRRILVLYFPAFLGGWALQKIIFSSLVTFISCFNLKLLVMILLGLGGLVGRWISRNSSFKNSHLKRRLISIWMLPFMRRSLITKRVLSWRESLWLFRDRGVLYYRTPTRVTLRFNAQRMGASPRGYFLKTLMLSLIWGSVCYLYLCITQ